MPRRRFRPLDQGEIRRLVRKAKKAPANREPVPELKEKIAAALEEFRRKPAEVEGGLILPRSFCCGAPIERGTGGLVIEICSRCRRPAARPRLGAE